MDLTQVAPGLYIASSFYEPDPHELEGTTLCVDFYGETMKAAYEQGVPLLVNPPLFDGPEVPAWFGSLVTMAHAVWRIPKTVVIACEAARNRGPLLAAAMLVKEGTEPADAITLIRSLRHDALKLSGGAFTNQVFVNWLLDQGKPATRLEIP